MATAGLDPASASMAGLLDLTQARSLAVALYTYIRETSLPLLIIMHITITFATGLFVCLPVFPFVFDALFFGKVVHYHCSFLYLNLKTYTYGKKMYAALHALAPFPRAPYPSEKTYITTRHDLSTSGPRHLPCWHDNWLMQRQKAANNGLSYNDDLDTGSIDEAELEMTVVIPAYNEEARLEIMLEEAIAVLDEEYGRESITFMEAKGIAHGNFSKTGGMGGYEILLVNDGSEDATVEVALKLSRRHGLHDILRIITLKENRGKGGAVTHGFRHARGAYVVFADADGASRFGDLGKLRRGCDEVSDEQERGVAVGSRAHLMGSEAVVKVLFLFPPYSNPSTYKSYQRSRLRNCLMHTFHLLLKLGTTPQTAKIRDTQCGFKLFSRASLPHIIPYMHAEGWIFDVEMLMLAESTPCKTLYDRKGRVESTQGIRVAEVPVGWKEVGGSKLNVVRDSLGMAWGLAVLRASWKVGVYRRR